MGREHGTLADEEALCTERTNSKMRYNPPNGRLRWNAEGWMNAAQIMKAAATTTWQEEGSVLPMMLMRLMGPMMAAPICQGS